MIHPPSASLLKLALARYPSMGLLAVECLLSDRRHAGLGALQRRQFRSGITQLGREKFEQPKGGELVVCYRWSHYEPQRQERGPELVPLGGPGGYVDRESTFTLRTIPMIDRQFQVNYPQRDFRTQEGRDRVAGSLRRARREVAADIRAQRGRCQ